MMAALCGAGVLGVVPIAPAASAEPGDDGIDGEAAVTDTGSAPMVFAPAADDPAGPVADACNRFSTALALAAANYEEFAYATAGGGDYVNYQDPNVERSNIIGRTVLRESAAAAFGAASLPGVPPEVGDPMRDWSMHATKLVLIMGLRGGGDSLNNAANQLNDDADRAQLACAVSMGGGPTG
jgi:hypothetical protein